MKSHFEKNRLFVFYKQNKKWGYSDHFIDVMNLSQYFSFFDIICHHFHVKLIFSFISVV